MHFRRMSIVLIGLLLPAIGAALPSKIEGSNVLTQDPTKISTEGKQGVVVVFLSAVCPCSDSHIHELSRLKTEYSEFSFVGVHSNTDEGRELTQKYFTQTKLPFPVIQDTNAKIADEFKAFKTPHAFVISPKGEILYQGGVSSSRHFDSADRKYLREALGDLKAGRKVGMAEGRTLGCIISRGKTHVW